MSIYQIENQGFDYQELDLEIDDFIDQFPDDMSTLDIHDFSKNNLALAPYWQTVTTGFSEIEGNKNLLPDITYWIGGTLVLSPAAYRYLGDLLGPCGEFLPVNINGLTYHIFNCLESIGSVKGVSPLSRPIIKNQSEFSENLYCDERFKSAIEEFNLNGIACSQLKK
jgi:hypothetical protein